MTSPEVAAAVARGATTVIWPLGATEQHGPHLPLGTDSLRAAALGERLARACPDALLAPVLPVGCSDEHSGFAGLLGVDHGTLARLIVDCAVRMAGWGVARLVLIPAHGGNEEALAMAAAALPTAAPRLHLVIVRATSSLCATLQRIAADDGISVEALGLHAGDGETSELLHLRPDLVRRDRLAPGHVEPLAEMLARVRQCGIRAVSASGTLGDPTRADPDRGARYLAAQVAAFSRQMAGAAAAADNGEAAP